MRISLIVYVLGILACDLALIGWEYRAKDAGRNQVRLYAPRRRSAPDKAPDIAPDRQSDEATGACP
ncbi:MAG TPA: hypothetical protein VGS06_01335 [Streptosporangiaceae bacterium]|nr:hypothetical protein [Streptosporangiaceae bacterium]